MDLKEFITETISAIVDATSELQGKYDEDDIIINPPSNRSSDEAYLPENSGYKYRRVQSIEFDVAVSASSDTSGGGKAGIKVMSLELGAKGEKSVSSEKVSRVSFSVPITLRPSSHEASNKSIHVPNPTYP